MIPRLKHKNDKIGNIANVDNLRKTRMKVLFHLGKTLMALHQYTLNQCNRYKTVINQSVEKNVKEQNQFKYFMKYGGIQNYFQTTKL